MCGPKNWPKGPFCPFCPKNCCISSGNWLDALSGLLFETTVTLTTAGVTRAAKVSMALSTAVRAATLLASSAGAAGAGVGTAAALAELGFTHSYVTTDPTRTSARKGAASRRVHIFMLLLSGLATFMVYFLSIRKFAYN